MCWLKSRSQQFISCVGIARIIADCDVDSSAFHDFSRIFFESINVNLSHLEIFHLWVYHMSAFDFRVLCSAFLIFVFSIIAFWILTFSIFASFTSVDLLITSNRRDTSGRWRKRKSRSISEQKLCWLNNFQRNKTPTRLWSTESKIYVGNIRPWPPVMSSCRI